MIKILMLVNWKVNRVDSIPDNIQAPDYFCKNEKYWFYKYFDKDVVVDVIDISTNRLFEKIEKKLHFYPIQSFKAFFKMRKYDVVISHGMPSGIVLALMRRIFKSKTKHIVFDIGSFNSAAEEGKILKLNQIASKSIDHIIYHTSEQRKYYEKFYPWLVDKSTFIPFGTDLKFFEKYKENKTNIENYEYILSIGYSKRDYDTLVKAYNEADIPVKLVIIGNDKIETYGNQNIILHNRISKDKLNEYIISAKFCVLPLKYMNYSFGQMTLLQQMFYKKCVVTANVPSVKDYVIDNETAILYESENISDLAKKLKYCNDNNNICQIIGEKASENLYKKYSEEVMAHKIEEVIKNVIK